MLAARFRDSGSAFTTDTLFALERYPTTNFASLAGKLSMTADGKYFLMTAGDQSRRLLMVVSWPVELRQRFAEVDRTR